MLNRRTSTRLGSVLAIVALAACATPGYSPKRIESELIKAGATPEQARCVAKSLPDKIDLNALGSHSAPSAITTAPTSSTSSTVPPTTVASAASTSSTTSTLPEKNEYELTRDALAECKVTLPLQPLP